MYSNVAKCVYKVSSFYTVEPQLFKTYGTRPFSDKWISEVAKKVDVN